MSTHEYFAGFFDGEGCITISTGGKVQVSITQKDKTPLEIAKTIYGGTIGLKDRKFTHIFCWRLSSAKDIYSFLNFIYPHSIVKKKEIEIGIQIAKLIMERGNRGCVPFSIAEYEDRMDLRNKLHALRESKIARNSVDKIREYRDAIKKQYDYKCNDCKRDLKELSPIYQIVSDDKLWCRSCNKKRHPFVIKPISKERTLDVINSSANLVEAAKRLGLSKSGLLMKRRKFSLMNMICEVCEKEFMPTSELRHYCSLSCAEIGKMAKTELQRQAYRPKKKVLDRQYYRRNRERILAKFKKC